VGSDIIKGPLMCSTARDQFYLGPNIASTTSKCSAWWRPPTRRTSPPGCSSGWRTGLCVPGVAHAHGPAATPLILGCQRLDWAGMKNGYVARIGPSSTTRTGTVSARTRRGRCARGEGSGNRPL